MKFLTLALGVFLATCSSQAVMAQETPMEICQPIAELVYDVAQGRDMGYPPQAMVGALIGVGLPPEVAMQVVTLVYMSLSGLSPSEAADKYLQVCLNGLA